MRIKRVEIVGFKSFKDRVVFHFDNNITGLVGPNGCGKSNLVDAIRWAMGEQSVKNLRGNAMEDVIFAGSESTGPLGMAEVVLTFENDGNAPAAFAEYAEISLGRRLFRSGESEYFINKTTCRLMDITDFFLGTGVGTKAYSIVEQGRVGQIVSAKPEDRRLLIEEAAGVTKYKAKKRAALRKMEATEQNLTRVRDILGEIGRRLGSLERQARKAERFKKYRAEMREIELWTSSLRYLELVAQEKRALRDEAELVGRQQAAETDLGAEESAVERLREELGEREREIFEVERSAQEVANVYKLNESHVEFLSKEAGAIARRGEENAQEVERLKDHLRQLESEDEDLERSLGACEVSRQGLLEQLRERDLARAALAEEREAAARALEEARARSAAVRARLETAKAEENALERRRHDLGARLAKARGERDELLRQLHAMERSLAHSRDALSDVRQLKLALEERRGETQEDLARARERAVELEASLLALRTELGDKRSRQRSLQEIEERFEGYADGVRAVMRKRARSRESGVLGLVTDVLAAPAELEPAVEAALGDRLQYVIVEHHEAGLEAIQYLKSESRGRSSFIPLSLRSLEHGGAPELGREGVVGHLRDLVSCEGVYAPIADYLLGDVTVVEDLPRALRLWRENGNRSRLVTLDGEVLDPWGVVTGGSRQGAGWGLLQKKREIKELSGEISRMGREVARVEGLYLEARKQVATLQGHLDTLRQDAHSQELTIVQGQKDVDRAEAELKRIGGRLEILAGEEREFEGELLALGAEEAELRTRVEVDAAVFAEIEGQIPRLGERAQEARERVESAHAEVTDFKVRVASLLEKGHALLRNRERNARSRQDAVERVGRLLEAIQAGLQEVRQLEEKSSGARAEMARLGAEGQALSARLGGMRQSFDGERGRLLEREAGLKGSREAVSELREGVHEARQRGSEASLGRTHLNQQIQDKYGEELRFQISLYHDRALPGEKEAARLAELRQILERMGDVNLTAIEEYGELKTRHDFLSTQEKDLSESLDSLRKAIAKINRTSRERFKETFEAVNEKFQEVFPRLFRGGRAYLQLTESADLLEAGVEIIAQPPGKKVQTVNLLSGGEKALTAVALIFAIFLIKPSPFCLLDEVDAPLDDANIGQFNELVLQMAEHSQFILITHNKRTMEIAENLYGVTMEEPGVSKLVNLELKQTARAAA
jgi:chromosome segregation protein